MAPSFVKNKTVLAPKPLNRIDYLVMMTKRQVYKQVTIGINDNDFTSPVFIYKIPKNVQGCMTLTRQYEISSEPKLEYTILLPCTV